MCFCFRTKASQFGRFVAAPPSKVKTNPRFLVTLLLIKTNSAHSFKQGGTFEGGEILEKNELLAANFSLMNDGRKLAKRNKVALLATTTSERGYYNILGDKCVAKSPQFLLQHSVRNNLKKTMSARLKLIQSRKVNYFLTAKKPSHMMLARMDRRGIEFPHLLNKWWWNNNNNYYNNVWDGHSVRTRPVHENTSVRTAKTSSSLWHQWWWLPQ